MDGKHLVRESLVVFHTVSGGYLGDNLVEIYTVYIYGAQYQ